MSLNELIISYWFLRLLFIRQVMGDYVSATRLQNMVKEMMIKVWLC